VEEAELVFAKMNTYANHVGLYSEEIAANGDQIGNFPQAFTHLALIDAAITLDAALDQGVATARGGPTALARAAVPSSERSNRITPSG
jgi:low temperature requirement protein LtrA